MQTPVHILFLEDNLAFADLVQDLMSVDTSLPWRFIHTTRLRDAQDRLQQTTIDVILCDLHIPDSQGIDTLLAFQQIRPDLPIVVLTGLEDSALGLEAVRQGAQDYLHKQDLTTPLLDRSLRYAIERVRNQLLLQQNEQRLTQLVEARTAQLQESEARYRQLFEVNPQPMWVYDLETLQFLAVNAAAIAKYGYSEAEFLAMSLVDIRVSPKTSQLLAEIATVNPGMNLAGVRQHRLKDGSLILVDMTSHALNYAGRQAMLVLVQDITEQFQAEQALRASEQKHRALVEALPDLVMRMKADGTYLDFFPPQNQKTCQAINLTHNNLFSGDLPLGLAEQRQCQIQQALQTGELQHYEQQIILNGQLRDEEVRIKPVREEEVIILIRDITDRKQAERALQQLNQDLETQVDRRTTALRESESRFRSMFEQSPVGIAITDLSGHITRANPSLLDMLGYTSADIAQQSIQTILDIAPAAPESSLVDQLVDRTLPTVSFETLCHPRHGQPLWLKVISTCLLDGFGRPTGSLHLIDNITTEKETQAELHRVTRLKDEFLANMSHELRTPLNAILGMAEGLSEGVFGSISRRQQMAIQTIDQSGRHLLALINDILDLSKVESGKLELQKAPVAVSTLCETSLIFIQQQAYTKNIHLSLEIPPDLPEIEVDKLRIQQVLINLLSNAVKFTPEGGSIRLVVQPDLAQQQLCLQVIDTGIGIAPAEAKKLFQPFVQIDNRLNRHHDGTGLGLALVRRLVDLHEGQVTVESAVGRGSCFTVSLPYLDLAQAASRLRTPTPAPFSDVAAFPLGDCQGDCPRVLLAVNNHASAASMGSYLTRRGCRVMHVASGRQLLDTAAQEPPNLILLEVPLPDLDSFAIIYQLRAQPALAPIPLMVLAEATASDRDAYFAAGIDEYLTKPVRLKSLVASIQILLSQVHSHAAHS